VSRLDSRARVLLELREKNSVAQRAADEAKAELDAYEAEFWSELEDLGMKSVSLDLGDPYVEVRLERRETTKSRVLDKAALVAWAREHGLAEELVKPEPRKAQLNEYVRTARENGLPLPDGLDFYFDRYVSVTRKRKR
jgi:hypothetical protein